MDETLPPFDGFARSGEALVRQNIEDKYITGGLRASAVVWLAWREEQRRTQSDALQAEQASAASRAAEAATRAADAAEAANTLARNANTTAKIAAAIAALALIASVAVPLILRH